jgi:MarR family transcriptional regulator, organic hydroperoxide resistance regulator
VKRLEAAGLVTRTRDSADERLLKIELTEAGARLRADAERIPPAVVAKLGIDIAELQQLHGALTNLIAAARAAGVEEIR